MTDTELGYIVLAIVAFFDPSDRASNASRAQTQTRRKRDPNDDYTPPEGYVSPYPRVETPWRHFVDTREHELAELNRVVEAMEARARLRNPNT